MNKINLDKSQILRILNDHSGWYSHCSNFEDAKDYIAQILVEHQIEIIKK